MQKRSRFPTQKILPMASKMMHVRSLIWCFCLKHNTCNFIRQHYYVILIATGFFCKNLKYRCEKNPPSVYIWFISWKNLNCLRHLDVHSMSEILVYKDFWIRGYFSFGLFFKFESTNFWNYQKLFILLDYHIPFIDV